jgi:hypothetical protein
MTNEEKYEEILSLIKDTSMYLTDLAVKGDLDKLNLYRIFLNHKIMEALKLRKKINE